MNKFLSKLRQKLEEQSGISMVEPMVGIAMMSIGMLGMAGMALSVATNMEMSAVRSAQALAAQEILERVHRSPYEVVTSGSETITIGPSSYSAIRTVTQVQPWVKEVSVTVADPNGNSSRTYTTRVSRTKQLPTS